MQVTARLRIAKDVHAVIKEKAREQRTSVSAMIREAMEPYLAGERTLPVYEDNDLQTNFTCYDQDLVRFKALAKEANLSWDEAVRRILIEKNI